MLPAVCAFVLTCFFILPGCANRPEPGETLFQLSSIGALMAGVLDGDMTCRDLALKGDTGLGTFNALDGEMIILDGDIWQVRTDGIPVKADPAQKVPFAVATFFAADLTIPVETIADLAELGTRLDEKLPTLNIMYAARISGAFSYLKTRSVPAQQQPYPSLTEAIAQQTVFELENVRGTMIGFRFPAYMSGVNVSGWHFHSITDDRGAGGHVLDCSFDALSAQVASLHEHDLRLPADAAFYKADLGTESLDSMRHLL